MRTAQHGASRHTQPLTVACLLLWRVDGRCLVGTWLPGIRCCGHGRWAHMAAVCRVAAVLLLLLLLSIMLLQSTA